MALPPAPDILSALPAPAVLIGRSHRVEAANAPAETLLGNGIVGRHYVTAIRQPAVIEAVEAVGGGVTRRVASYLARRGGQDATWRVHVAQAGEAILVTFEDTTAAQEAGQMRRDFVANVSHELKTPLTAMIGFIETLRGPARNDETARERFLATMMREAQRMARLVEDLLSLSRVEANERIRPRESADVDLVLAGVVTMLSGKAEEAEVALSYARAPAPVVVNGDPDQLRQVAANLVENAIKYGGTRVDLSLSVLELVPELRRAGVVIEVADDGPGIDSMHLPRLTERFYRVDTHRSRAVGGTGLGLAIVKHIVSRHRGRLLVDSKKGRGTTFRVLLPRET